MKTVFSAAKYFLHQLASGRKLDTVKLQKMLYFAQGWKLGRDGAQAPLFPENIVAWRYGPVVPDLYYTHAGRIALPFNFYDTFDVADPTADEKVILDFVVSHYGGFQTFDLADYSHKRGAPWATATNNGDSNLFGAEISEEVMADYFNEEFDRIAAGGPVVTL